MAAYTSQILIGQKHSYDSGIINLSHTLYLSENSRPAWILKSTDNKLQKITWIPTLENMLEDALVMIGLYVLKDQQLKTLAKQYFVDANKDFIELYDDIKTIHLQELYEQAREIESSHKITLSVFQGSSILRQLAVLKNYRNDIEVCKSIYSKEFSLWSKNYEELGEL